MWVFGYGSLMWDRWEEAHGCVRRAKAILSGYRRIFNKPSVRNWGTKTFPCPTLNLMRSNASFCHGMAFEFLDDRKKEIRTYLAAREGKDLDLHELAVRLHDGNEVIATVAIYEGKNLTPSGEIKRVAEVVLKATGRDGPCIHYLKGINDELHRLGINDPAVRDLWGVVGQSD